MRDSTSGYGDTAGRLVLCPVCTSGLIYPTDIAGSVGVAIVSRRCPECEHRDVVSTCPLAALVWFDRTTRIGAAMGALSDAIEEGLPVEFLFDDPPSPGPRRARA